MMRRLKYRLQHWRRQVWLACGFCPRCGNRVNHTPTGRAICPQCGR